MIWALIFYFISKNIFIVNNVSNRVWNDILPFFIFVIGCKSLTLGFLKLMMGLEGRFCIVA